MSPAGSCAESLTSHKKGTGVRTFPAEINGDFGRLGELRRAAGRDQVTTGRVEDTEGTVLGLAPAGSRAGSVELVRRGTTPLRSLDDCDSVASRKRVDCVVDTRLANRVGAT